MLKDVSLSAEELRCFSTHGAAAGVIHMLPIRKQVLGDKIISIPAPKIYRPDTGTCDVRSWKYNDILLPWLQNLKLL